MTRPNLDLDVLRTFVAGVDLGGYGKAAAHVGRSASAVSLQLRKLEQLVGHPLLAKRGRYLVLTETGETMLGFARRLLELNDTALAALQGPSIAGVVRLGLPQDVAETRLPDVLARFGRLHPDVRIDARVERSAVLRAAFDAADLDIALLWSEIGSKPTGGVVVDVPMVWVGPRDWPTRQTNDPIRLVVFDSPCLFRSAALAALDTAEIPWRISFSSPSLSGLWAAVSAGLGLTIRTTHSLPPTLIALDPIATGLPKLPRLSLQLLTASANAAPAIELLAKSLRESFA